MAYHWLQRDGASASRPFPRRKALAMGVTLGLMVAPLAACSGSSSTDGQGSAPASAGGGSLSIQTPWPESSPAFAPLAAIVEEFQAANPDIEVTVDPQPTDQTQKIFTSKLLSGDAPDIIMTNPTRDALSWVEQGATVSVSDYLVKWGLDKTIYPQALEDTAWLTADGNLRGFPLTGFVWPTWYTADSVVATGGKAPASESDVEKYVAGLNGAGSVIVGGADWSGFNAFLQTLQSYLSLDDLNTLAANGGWADNADARKGAEWFVKLRDLGFWSPDSTGQTVDGANAAFQGGQNSGLTLISDFFGDVPPELASSIVLGGIPIPADANVEHPTVMAAFSSTGVMISDSGNKSNLANIQKFVEFLYQPDNLAKFVDQGGMVVAADSAVSATPSNALLAQSQTSDYRDSVTFVGASTVPTSIIENLTRAASLAWTKGATADKILAAMDSVY